eukprot:scaffold10717_cov61-Phaeocystis_antarctica.AAC.8
MESDPQRAAAPPNEWHWTHRRRAMEPFKWQRRRQGGAPRRQDSAHKRQDGAHTCQEGALRRGGALNLLEPPVPLGLCQPAGRR